MREARALVEDVVSLKWVNRKLWWVNEFVFFHLSVDTITKLGPFLLVLAVFCLHYLGVLSQDLRLLFHHRQLFSKLLAFILFLTDVLIKLVDSFLKVINLNFHSFLFLLEFFLNLEYLNVDHLILLNFRDQLLLGQRQIVINLFKLLFDLLHLSGIISREEPATAKVPCGLCLRCLLLPLILQFLKCLNSFSEPLVVIYHLLNFIGFFLELLLEISDVLSLLLNTGGLLFEMVPERLILLLELFVFCF